MKLSDFNVISEYKINSRKRLIIKCGNIECGNTYDNSIQNAKRRKNNLCKSCDMKSKKNRKTHGFSEHRLYEIWTGMKKRCYNDKSRSFVNYGGRGIVVCDDWKNSFINFYNWSIENGYDERLFIDRIDNDGNYEPINCRFTNKNVQARNTRRIMSTNTSGYRGVSKITGTDKYKAVISVGNKMICIMRSYDKIECAKAYDRYIIENNLEHTRNFS